MRCSDAFEALSARFDGELRATEIPLLQAHLASCPDCRAQDQQLSLVARRLRGAAVEQPPVPAALRARITRSITPARPRRMPFVFGLALVGAGVGLGALAMVARARPAAVSPAELADAIRIEGEGDESQIGSAQLDQADQDWARVSQQLIEEIGARRSGDSRPGVQAHGASNEVRPSSNGTTPSTSLTPGTRIAAGRRSLELALGPEGHLSLAPGGRLQAGQGTDVILLAGRATIDVTSPTAALRLRTAGGEVMMPKGRFEIRAAVGGQGHDRRNDRNDDVDETTTVAQVLTLAGSAQVISAGQELWLSAGTRGWLRPDRPPLPQDRLGGLPSPAIVAGSAGASAAVAASAPAAAPMSTDNNSAAPGSNAERPPSPTTQPGNSPSSGTVVAVGNPQPPALGRVHGVVIFSAVAPARRSATEDRGCSAQSPVVFVRLAQATAVVSDRHGAAEPDRPSSAGDSSGVPASITASLDACGLNPAALTVGIGQSIELRNRSDVPRRINVAGNDITIAAGGVEQLRFGRNGRFDLTCDGTSTPCGQISVAPTPVIATTDAEGTFTADGVPAGPHNLIAWRSDRATAYTQIDVQPNATTEVRLILPDEAVAAPAVAVAPAPNGNGNGNGRVAAQSSSNARIDFDPTSTIIAYGNGPNSCRFAHVDSPIGKACLRGGLKDAKKEMKAMIKLAKDRGMKFDCDSCHKNEEDWKLNGDARALFARVLETIKT